MPLPCPGPSPISLLDITNEFVGNNSRINSYYRGGTFVQNITENSKIPTSGQISFDQFFCSTGEIVVYITTNSSSVNVKSLFGTNWTTSRSKRLVINSGVIVYNTSNSASAYALIIFDDFNGKLTIENRGSIQGGPGRRGGDTIISGESRTNRSNGGNGGNAIYIGPTTAGAFNSKIVYINNLGTIYAGGGGGGEGVASSTGYSDYVTRSYRPYGTCCPLDVSLRGKGTNKGLGGWGQGYNQTNTAGTSGTTVFGAEISVSMTSLGSNGWRFPPNSTVSYNANISGQNGTHRFGSKVNLSYNMTSSGTPGGLSFNGTGNSIVLTRNSSGFTGTLTKDPNQSYTDNVANSGPIGTINNVTGGGPEQTAGILVISTNGVSDTINIPVPTTSSGSAGGTGGTWGTKGVTVTSGGSGGSAGYSIVNESKYVSYIRKGTISGLTN